MRTLVVVPTYNEADNVVALAQGVAATAPDAELLVVDDNSPDHTADIAERYFQAHAGMAGYRVLRRTGARGLGRAYRQAFQLALTSGYDRIVQMDADLSHDPAYLPNLLAFSNQFDLVVGSRYCGGGGVRNWPRHRILLSRFAGWYVHTVAGIPIADATAGYRVWSRAALQAVDLGSLRSEGYAFMVEMSYRACRAGLRVKEVPIIFTDRRFGRSKISRTVLVESFLMPWSLRFGSWRPLSHGVAPAETGNPIS